MIYKRILVLGLTLCMLSMTGSSANAARLVLDVKNLAEARKTYDKIYQQYLLIKQNLESLKGGDQYAKKVGQQILLIAVLHEQVKGLVFDYEQMQKAWDETYKDFAELNGMGAREYAEHAKKTLQKTNEAIEYAMKAQGLVSGMKSDVELLEELLKRSANAQGALEAAQIGHYIASIEITQLMRLQEIVSASYRAQCAYYEHLLQNEAMAKVQAEKLLINEPNPLANLLGIGPGFGF